MKDLKSKVIRGGLARLFSQGTGWGLRLGSLMILARLLDPKDFGLVAMVTVFTGILNLFRDFGLSAATVQRGHISDEQVSTLFWINILVGLILALILMAASPIVVAYYREPRLLWVSIVLSSAFLFNGAGVQHTALLERQMRFSALAAIDIFSLLVSTLLSVGMAAAGFGYWSLVAAAVSLPLVTTVCLWFATGWAPSWPRWGDEIHSLLRFGGIFTFISLIVYVTYNFEKVLLGRYWGADALGLYGRGYQIINLPTDSINSAFWGVAFSGLSRVRDDPDRFRNYFLKGYSLVLGLTIPMTIAAALFARDLILVLLGPKWVEVIEIFRLLAPTILVFAIINPLAWLTFSLGLVIRNLKIVVVMAPLVIGAYLLGLSHGPKGVALAYSAALLVWAIPCIVWSVHGTVISPKDVLAVVRRPVISGIVAAGVALGVQLSVGHYLPALARLVLDCSVLFGSYAGMLLYVMGQKRVYVDLIRGMRKRPAVDADVLASV